MAKRLKLRKVTHVVVETFWLFGSVDISSRLAIKEHNIKLPKLPYANDIVILLYLYPVLPIIETVPRETNQLDSLEGTALKSVNHTSKCTVLMFTVSK